MSEAQLLNHPLLTHLLTEIRDQKTPAHVFRKRVLEIGHFMAYELCRNIKQKKKSVTTPLETAEFDVVGEEVVAISIMRAGNILLEAALDVLPFARGGHIGLKRVGNGESVDEYYCNIPDCIKGSTALLLDPMVATGGSACVAIEKIKAMGPAKIKLAAILITPEAEKRIFAAHPDIELYTVAKDRELNEKNYILPGLGDAGDRIYGTF